MHAALAAATPPGFDAMIQLAQQRRFALLIEALLRDGPMPV